MTRTATGGTSILVLALMSLSSMTSAHTSAEPRTTPHPEPRVIVTVAAMKGPHDRAAVQRSAREAWGPIVRCYKELGRGERGKLTVRLEISATGKTIGARRLGSTLNDDVSACVTTALRNKGMPKAGAGSSATLEVQLAPGDE